MTIKLSASIRSHKGVIKCLIGNSRKKLLTTDSGMENIHGGDMTFLNFEGYEQHCVEKS